MCYYKNQIICKKSNYLFFLFLLSSWSCWNSKVSIASAKDPLAVKISCNSCEIQGYTVAADGSCTAIIECKGSIESAPKGFVGVVGLPKGRQLTSSLLDKAILERTKTAQNGQQWTDKLAGTYAEDGSFIFWKKGYTTETITNASTECFSFKIEQNKTSSNDTYQMYMVYVEKNSSDLFHSLQPIEITTTKLGRENLQHSGLEMPDYDQTANNDNPIWHLKGKYKDMPCKPDKVGFILTKSTEEASLWIQEMVASKRFIGSDADKIVMPELISIPGDVKNDADIYADLNKNDVLGLDQTYEIYSYAIQGDRYYISCPARNKLCLDKNMNQHPLQSLDIKVYCNKFKNKIESITFDGNTHNNTDPVHKAYLVFFKKGFIWRTKQILALFETIKDGSTTAAVTDDAALCLVADNTDELLPSYWHFFSKTYAYEYFSCLINPETSKIVSRTESKPLDFLVNKIPPNTQDLHIVGSSVNDQSITLTITGNPAIEYDSSKQNKYTFKPPAVDSTGQNISAQGFIIGFKKRLQNDQAFRTTVQAWVDSGGVNSPTVKNDQAYLIFKANQDPTEYIETPITAFLNQPTGTGQPNIDTLSVIYWEYYKDKTLCLSNVLDVAYKHSKATDPATPPADGTNQDNDRGDGNGDDVHTDPSKPNTTRVFNKDRGFLERLLRPLFGYHN